MRRVARVTRETRERTEAAATGAAAGMEDEAMASQATSRASSRNSGRSPGITLNRPLAPGNSSGFYTLPRRDFSCPPAARSAFLSRRSSASSGVLISSMFGSRFRYLQKLHTDAFALGLNAVCFPGLPVGTMFRSSLPATPVSTPIHRDVFTHFTEESLRERLCKSPSPRKPAVRTFSPLDMDPSLSLQEDPVSERLDSSLSEQAMDITPSPSTPIEEAT